MVYGNMVYGNMVYGNMVYGNMVYGNMVYGNMVYGKGFFPKFDYFEIYQKKVCKCSLGPFEHFTNKPWSVVQPFDQN